MAGPYLAYHTDDVATHKRMVLALSLAVLPLFYWLLLRWEVRAPIAQLSVLCLTLLYQMRMHDDPFLTSHGILQAIAILLLLALLAIDAYHRSSRPIYLAACALCYGIALVTDEASYGLPLVLLAPLWIRAGDWRVALRRFSPLLLLSLIAMILVIWLRIHHADTIDSEDKLHWSLPKILKTWAAQTGGAAPLGYLALCAADRAAIWRPWTIALEWESWAALIAAVGLSLFLLRRVAEDRESTAMPQPVVKLAGLALWLVPALCVAMCARHQARAVGAAYLPVYLECFGLALIIAWGLAQLRVVLPGQWRKCAWSLALVNGIVATLTLDMNRAVVASWREVNDLPMRSMVEAAFAAGLGEEIPADATIAVTTWR